MKNEWFFHIMPTYSAVFRHVLLWLGFYIGFSIVMSTYNEGWEFLFLNLTIIASFILAYYPLRYYLIPKHYEQGKRATFYIMFCLQIIGLYCFHWGSVFIISKIFNSSLDTLPFQYLGEFLIKSLRFFSPSILLLVWEYQHNRIRSLIRLQEIEKEKLNTEIKYLKSQINPHFLFNSLNNLYSFVIRESPKALDMITRLTGILEYILTKSQESEVALESEVRTIEHYLELEKVRYGQRLQVKYEAHGIDQQGISPLIFLSIIENAFKHGASGDIDHPEVQIHIDANEEQISCQVWNTKSKYEGEINDAYKKGIGLNNIKRQLDLIYPERHSLFIEDNENSFEVNLQIQL